MHIVVSILSSHSLAWIWMPTAAEVASFQHATAEKYPSCTWVTCDGVKLNFQSTGEHRIQ